MKHRFISILILISFLLFSCSNSFDYKARYEAGKYEDIIENANEELSIKLNQDALYYLFVSQFKLGYIDDSLSAARLYSACYSSNIDQRLRDSLRILLFYSNDFEKCYAGEKLNSLFSMSETELIVYFSSLMKTEKYSQADALYNQNLSKLSLKSRCLMLIGGKASTDLIVSSLNELEAINDPDIDSILIQAINVLNERAEGSKLLDLALKHYDSSKDNLALVIGDIYRLSGDIIKARSYWSMAYKTYPDDVKQRLKYL